MATGKRIAREKRPWLLALVALALINLAVYVTVVYPLAGRVAAAGQRAESAARDLGQALREEQQARNTVAGQARAAEDLTRFYEEILPGDQAEARRITYLRLAQMAQRANLRFERRTFAAQEVRHSQLSRLEMTMVLRGAYRDVRRFIHQLETSPEFVVITNVGLAQQRREQGDLLELTLALATYYRTVDGP
jgi:Tfp pilus assembly protein PilO